MVVQDGQGRASIFCGENVKVVPKDLRKRRTRSGLIVDDQHRWLMVTRIGDESRKHRVTCISISSTGQGNRANTWGFDTRLGGEKPATRGERERRDWRRVARPQTEG